MAPTASSSTAASSSPGGTKSGGGKDIISSALNEVTNTTGIMDYLRSSLARDTLLELYIEATRGRFVCRAVLQQLSTVASQVVVRLSCTGGSFPLSGIKVWMTTTSANANNSQQQAVLLEMYRWAIIKEYNANNASEAITLTPQFASGLKESLCSLDSSPWMQLNALQIRALEQEANEPQKPAVSLEDLERYTQTQWDAVLHFLVGTTGKKEPPPAVVHFLLQTGLMQPDPEYVSNGGDEDDAPLVITQKGYDFMLQDNYQQVWHFVVQYLKSLETHKKAVELRKEALLLLICLSFARVGEAYLASSLSKDQRVMMKHIHLFGLLFTRKIGKATIFYPTRVAMQLVGTTTNSSSAAAASSRWSMSSKVLESALSNPHPQDSSHLAIIVQTNFQLCAYTTSELHVSMLGLFCDVYTIRRLPNVVFMNITRDSVKSAFALGIQARQILRFLEKHAHPKLRANPEGPIPGNVVDQIWLWDRERGRVRFTEVYQHQCLMSGEFQAIHQYAQDKGALAWSSDRLQKLFIDFRYVERIESYARQWRARTASRQHEAGG